MKDQIIKEYKGTDGKLIKEVISLDGRHLTEVDEYEEVNGQLLPKVRVRSTEVHRPDGRVDVRIDIPCINLSGKFIR